MKRFSAAAAVLACALRGDPARGFAAAPRPPPRPAVALRDQSAGGDEASYFQMQRIPTATSGGKLDHIVACSEHGECDVAEMMTMIDELEDLNAECQGALSRECHLDAVAARNVLKVALASRVVLAAKVVHEAECLMPPEEDPYAALADLEDACPPGYVRALPAATAGATALDRVVACAEDADAACDVDEMLRMVAELEDLNAECEGALSRECSLDAVTARNVLKVALASKALQ